MKKHTKKGWRFWLLTTAFAGVLALVALSMVYLFLKYGFDPSTIYQRILITLSRPEIGFPLVVFLCLILLLVLWKQFKFLIEKYKKIKAGILHQFDWLLQKRKRLIVFCCVLFLITAGGFSINADFTDTAGTPNLPDSYDYQSIAVNYAYGNEFPVSGTVHPIEVYKFESLGQENLEKLRQTAGFPSLHRAPVFGLFCGLVYKICGIHPIVIKYLLLIILCFTGVFLVYLGAVVLGKKGLIAGLIAGIFLMVINQASATVFAPGSIFISLWVIISFFVSYRYMEKPGVGKIALMGLLFASSWLVNFSMMLAPVFILLWLIVVAIRKKHFRQLFAHMGVFIVCVTVVLLPWQIFTNTKYDGWKPKLEAVRVLALDSTKTPEAKRIQANLIMPSTGAGFIPDTNLSAAELDLLKVKILPFTRQNGYYPDKRISEGMNKMAFLEDILNSPDLIFLFLPKPNHEILSCHNELMQKGMIAQDWRVRDCYYTRQDSSVRRESSRLAGFYISNPMMFFTLTNDKLHSAFGPYNELLAIFGLWAGVLFIHLFRRKQKISHRIVLMIATLCIPFLLLLAISMLPWLFVCCLLLFSLSLILFPRITSSPVFDRLSGLFFFNYIFTVIISFGIDRYLQPLQFLMLFFAVYLHLLFIGEFKSKIKDKG